MIYSDQVVGRIGALPDEYLIVRRSGDRRPIIYLQRATGGEIFQIAGAYQGGVLGAFVLRLVPIQASTPREEPVDVPIITMEQYGDQSLPLLLEVACNQGLKESLNGSPTRDRGISPAPLPAEGSLSKVTILGSFRKPNSLWKDSIAGVLHDRDGHRYFVVNRTTERLGKMCFPFLQDEFAQVWQVRAQQMQGWLKKVLVVDLVGGVGLRRRISAVATQDALDKAPGSTVRWVALAEQCQRSVAEAPDAGIFSGMRGDFFWHPTDPDRLVAESNVRAQACP